MLTASFVYAVDCVRLLQPSRLSQIVSQMPRTPTPVILVKSIAGGAVVEWVHQKEISDTGPAIFPKGADRSAK
jgi:hypothetical protein